MDNIAFILQARVGSTRLPQKMLLPFYEEKGVFELLINKLKISFPDIPIIVATSTNVENNALIDIAIKNNVLVFRGSEHDVLQRYISAAEKYEIKNIIRICADNPFLDIEEIDRLIKYVAGSNSIEDYVSFHINEVPSIKTHFGFWTEFVKLEVLKKVDILTKDPFYHEHVTNYIYGNPSLFTIKFLDVTTDLKNRDYIRMTLDTKEDFNLLSNIYSDMVKYKNDFLTIKDVISYLDENPVYQEKMRVQILNNTK